MHDIRKIFGLFDPLLPCQYLELIYDIKFSCGHLNTSSLDNEITLTISGSPCTRG